VGDVTRAFYLDGGGEPVFALLDEPAGDQPRGLDVLLCPPFGWQEVSSYRSRFQWARQLAAAGHRTLRIDLPGTGDSGGWPRDHGRLAAWADAIAAAATWLAQDGSPGVAAIGFGLGAVPLCRAIADGAPVDALVLWGVTGRGRQLVREQRAAARLEAAQQPPSEAPVIPDGAVVSAGYLLTAETQADLEAFDADWLGEPSRVRRALLLERDGIAVDERLQSALTASGAQVSTAPGDGYAEMFMAEPQDARAPGEVTARVATFLQAEPDGSRPAADPAPVAVHESATMTGPNGGRMRETPLRLATPRGQIVGILTEPEGARRDVTVVMLNAGAQRRIGVNRMWVEIARRWGERGVASLRLDVEGIGDADGDSARFSDFNSFYVPEFVDQVRLAMDDLVGRGLPEHFLLLGLCSGAYWSFHTALADPRVDAALMLNTRVLVWSSTLLTSREADRFARSAVSAGSWRRILSGETSPDRLVSAARSLSKRALAMPARARAARESAAAGPDELEGLLDAFQQRGQRGLLLFTAEEPVYEELERDGYLPRWDRWPSLKLAADERLRSGSGEDHTLRPLWLQQHVHELLDAELDAELALRDEAGHAGGAGGVDENAVPPVSRPPSE
jgi:pimeloyl-ACP methyl ester carboxylesterase